MEEKSRQGLVIIRLNPVDFLTLFGVFLSGAAIAMMLAQQLEYAISLLYLAVITDAFDGVLARKYGLTRDFGRYLDGFVDAIDYLIAPAIFLYVWGFDTWWQSLLLYVFVCCGFIRLSVFNEIGNIKSEDNGLSYLGAPVFWSVLVLGPVYLLSMLLGEAIVFYLLAVAVPVFSFLMLHNGPYMKFKNPKIMLVSLLAMAALFFLLGASRQAGTTTSGASLVYVHFFTGLLAAIPVIVAGVLHMAVVRFDLLPFLKIPVSKSLFGQNKTLRGFVVMPLFSILGFWLLHGVASGSSVAPTVNFDQYSVWVSGLILGLAYVLAELPNSFIKRRMGAAPGELPQQNARLFMLMDQFDSGLLCLFAYWYFWQMPPMTCVATLIMIPVLALGIKRILFLFGLKKTST